MATRMQQRRGTAAQWTSADPVLNAGEMGWESDTNKFKIGDGTNHWVDLDYFSDINSTVNPAFGSSITFEGATADSYETILAVTDPTADRTVTFPDATGTVVLKDSTDTFTNKSISLSTNTVTGTKAQFNTAMSDADFATLAGTETFTNKTLTSHKRYI
jgi:Major tropism determinant N-terminal domain